MEVNEYTAGVCVVAQAVMHNFNRLPPAVCKYYYTFHTIRLLQHLKM